MIVNMKKYKLIKMYPGVYINVGDIVFEKFDGCYFPENGGNAIGSDKVENFPEFWEEIKEDKFKILSFDDFMGNIFTLNDGGIYTNGNLSYGKEYSLEYFGIQSVKRISDGQIFKLGDYITCENSHIKTPEEIIKIGKNKFDNIILFTSSFNKNGISIHKAKLSIPTFKTEDGVEYFEDTDTIWAAMNLDIVNSTYIATVAIDQAKFQNTRKFYSTYVAAVDYVRTNLKCLSLNDVWNMSKNKDSKDCYVVIGKSDLQKLVKERTSQL